MKNHVQGVIFDMDGLMIDTEKYYIRFFYEAANNLGYQVTREQILFLRSMASEDAAIWLKEQVGSDFDYDKVKSIYEDQVETYFAKNNIEIKKGLFELLKYLKEKGIKIAVATTTSTERAHSFLKRIQVLDYFDAVFTRECIKNCKPEPEIYIKAAQGLGLEPEQCMALEDSPNGVLAASRAGCMTVMVPDLTLPDAELKENIYAEASDLNIVISIIQQMNR